MKERIIFSKKANPTGSLNPAVLLNQPTPRESLIRLIQEETKREGNFIIGFSFLGKEGKKYSPEIQKASDQLSFAISLAVPLNLEILRTIVDHPTVIYKHHYQQINYLLDRISLRIAQIIERENYQALPIPASVYTSRNDLQAHLCHREIAFNAGIGWWGKCNLIVHPRFGAGIRLATILTDLELPATPPLDNNCGNCRACREACPAHAIGEDISAFNRPACFAQLREFERKVIGVGICGICVRACRKTRERIVKSKNPPLTPDF